MGPVAKNATPRPPAGSLDQRCTDLATETGAGSLGANAYFTSITIYIYTYKISIRDFKMLRRRPIPPSYPCYHHHIHATTITMIFIPTPSYPYHHHYIHAITIIPMPPPSYPYHHIILSGIKAWLHT